MNLFVDAHPADDSVLDAVLHGLSTQPKTLPPGLFYDEEGSRLFEEITRLPEYYPTRTETGILLEHIEEMVDLIGAHATLVEYGSGSSTKTRILLDRLPPGTGYVPIDISREHLLASSESLQREYPHLRVLPVCADYHRHIPQLASYTRSHRATVFFPGSTIGNFIPEHARSFLRNAADLVGPGGGLLIGIDLRKDPSLLRTAYDDSRGVTAAFNLNMLRHVNDRLGPVFPIDRFRHRAVWNDREGRIEMHLVAEEHVIVSLDGRSFEIDEGEPLVTEYSYKYTDDEALSLLRDSGFDPIRCWTDPDRMFSVHYARASPA